jgi:hypothetical protein
VEIFKPCPYCGILFSGKHGTNKRKELRTRKDVPFTSSHNGQFFEGSTLDISEEGMCIKIDGRISLSRGDILLLNLNGSKVSAQIVWISDDPDALNSCAGLKVLDGKLDF